LRWWRQACYKQFMIDRRTQDQITAYLWNESSSLYMKNPFLKISYDTHIILGRNYEKIIIKKIDLTAQWN
jgi:hypothetical protein